MVRVVLAFLAGLSLLSVSARGSEPPPRPVTVPGEATQAVAPAGRPATGITLPRPTHRIVEPRPTARLLVPEPRSREVAPELPGRRRMVPEGVPVQVATPPAADAPQMMLPRPASGTVTTVMTGPRGSGPHMDDPQPAYGPETFAATARAADEYRRIQRRGGWPALEERTGLAEGASGEKVAALKQILAAQGDLPEPSATDPRFDAETAEAVRRFEFRHGLAPTGTVAGATLAALRVPAAVRQAQLQASARRLGLIPFAFGGRYLVLNRAAGEIEAVSDGVVARRYAVRLGPGTEGADTRIGAVTGIRAGGGSLRLPVEGPVPLALVDTVPAEGEIAVLGLSALAAWLLADPDGPDGPVPDAAGLAQAAQARDARDWTLRRPISLALVYLTGFSGRDGMVRFRPDPLGLDQPGVTAGR